jgi:flagellar biosynthetic protein FliS
MSQNRNQLAYQEAAVRNATTVELVIMLHDVLGRDLHSAIAAMEAKDIEARSAKLKHAFLALAQLENTLNMEVDGVEKISRFYTMARGQMLKSQVQQDPGVLRELAGFVADMRGAWAEVSGRERGGGEVGNVPQISKSSYKTAEVSGASWKA